MGSVLKLIIGGSASTGSTLLARILNRHSQLYCGPETNIFTKNELIDSWESRRHTLISPLNNESLPTSGWHLHDGHQLLSMVDQIELQNAVNQSNTYNDFIEYIFRQASHYQKKNFVIEKTPSNSVLFEKLIPIFPETRFLLMIRHPLDTISSMVNRGWSPIYSTGLYLFNISMGWNDSDRLGTMKYENLVKRPIDVLNELTNDIQLPFESEILIPEEARNPQSQITSWRFSEMSGIKEGPDSFSSLSKKKQYEIISAIKHLRFKKSYDFCGIHPTFNNIFEIADQFGYELKREEFRIRSHNGNWVHLHLHIEKLKRVIKKGAIGYFDFPFITKAIQ